MINNDEIIILDGSLLMINSKSMYNYLLFWSLWEVHLEAYEDKITVYNRITTDPNNDLLL